MLLVTTLLFFTACALAQEEAPAEEMPKTDTEDKYGIFDKVKKIVSGASISCQNKYITHPMIENVLCGEVVPKEYTQKLGITFGADTPWCAGLACVYRAMGCPDPTYRVEARIIHATGQSETCLETAGLDKKHCQTLSKFIAKVPSFQDEPAEGGKKRSVERTTPYTYETMTENERQEAKRVAANAVRHFFPHEDHADLNDIMPAEEPFDEKKRGLEGIVEELQVCSPLIATGLMLLESSVKLPVNASEMLGPCGRICNWAVCGLNVLCSQYATPILEKINNDRKYSGVAPDKCPPLSCATFIKAPKSVCESVECPVPDGHFNEENCPAPMVVHIPLKTTTDDCCTRCDNPCQGVNCPAVSCPEPNYPDCVEGKIAKYSVTDCCAQCIDPCFAQRPLCPPAPTSCPANQFLGPARPGDCCLSCQPRCVGVSCVGKPTAQECASRGLKFQPPSTDPTRCSDCCGSCVNSQGNLIDGATHNAVASVFATAAAAAAAAI